jgi:hypothetical protein
MTVTFEFGKLEIVFYEDLGQRVDVISHRSRHHRAGACLDRVESYTLDHFIQILQAENERRARKGKP